MARSTRNLTSVVHLLLPVVLINIILIATGVINRFYNHAFAGVLAGTVLFPVLMPIIPTKDFSTKGFIVGAVAALPIVILDIISSRGAAWYVLAGAVVGSLLLVSAISAFISLNFTGSSTFTSKTGVREEMFRYIPVIASSFGVGLALTIILRIFV